MKAYIREIARFLLLLLVIQLIRGLVVTGLYNVFHPASDLVRWAYMDMIAFSLVGMGLISFFRPTRRQLALEWESAPRWERIVYISVGVVTLALFGTSYFFGQDIFIMNFDSVLVLPIFEELLFRGWGWTRLEQVACFKNAQIVNWLVISVLFGLWHFGYLDIYMLKVAPMWPHTQWGNFYLMKFITTFIIGIIVGIPRWRTGRVYGSILLHMLINLFGK